MPNFEKCNRPRKDSATRLKSQLPKALSKKLVTVKGLVKEMRLELNTENKAPKTGKKKRLSEEIKDKTKNCYSFTQI